MTAPARSRRFGSHSRSARSRSSPFAVRVAFVVVVDPSVPKIGDASAYHLLGENLARGRGYIRPFDYLLLHQVRATAEYPPLFPALLAIPGPPRRAQRRGAAHLRFASSAACTVVLVGLLGRRVASPAVGLVAAGLAAVYPMLFQSEGILMAEALYALLVTLVLLLAYRAHAQPTVGRFAALGAAIGFATLTRAEGFLLGLVLVVPLCPRNWAAARLANGWSGPESRSASRWSCSRRGRFATPCSSTRSCRCRTTSPRSSTARTVTPTYSGTELGLWRESFSQVGDVARELPQAHACFEGFDIADPHFDEAKVASKHRRDGLTYASHHLRSQPKVMAVRVLRTWGLYAPRQQVNFETLEGRPTRMAVARHAHVLGNAAVRDRRVFVLYRRRALLWPLLATVVTVTIVSALTYGQQRFRIAAEPAILVLAAVARRRCGPAGRRTPHRSPAHPESDERIVSADAG